MAAKKRKPKAPQVAAARVDYYLAFVRADEALRSVAERDAAVQEVLGTIRARIDQQLGEVEAFTRDWDRSVDLLKEALTGAQELHAELVTACKLLKPARRER